jgi:hypothetical protein
MPVPNIYLVLHSAATLISELNPYKYVDHFKELLFRNSHNKDS